jgi:hypothetical protein
MKASKGTILMSSKKYKDSLPHTNKHTAIRQDEEKKKKANHKANQCYITLWIHFTHKA